MLFLSLSLTAFIILLPFASAYARVGNVMMFCMLSVGGFFFRLSLLLLYKFIQFLLHSGITDVSCSGRRRGRGTTKGDFFLFSRPPAHAFLLLPRFLFRMGECGWQEKEFGAKLFTRLIFVGNFSTINVSAKREREKKTARLPFATHPSPKKKKHKTFLLRSSGEMMIISSKWMEK